MHTVALVTDNDSPDLSESDATLVAPLGERGITAVAVPWESDATDWRMFAAVVLRSCWNYHRHLAAFHAWIDRCERDDVRLWNTAATVRWNVDKRYLRDLAGCGIPVVPTVWLEHGSDTHLIDLLVQQGWDKVVIKPRVSASARGIWQSSSHTAVVDQERFAAMVSNGGVMVQPLLPEIADGEWSMIFFGDSYSHAVLKRPAADTIFVQQRFGGVAQPITPPEVVRTQAMAAVRAAMALLQPLGEALLYTRVDGLVVDGTLLLMELELTEPGLFLNIVPDAPDRFAQAIAAVCSPDATQSDSTR